MNDADVKHLLETAARTSPRETDPVTVVLRRRSSARRRTALVATGTGALAACAAVAVAVVVGGIGTPEATRIRLSPCRDNEYTEHTVVDTAAHRLGRARINGVRVGAQDYSPQVSAANADGTAPCPRSG